jgi:polysaccharide export outer membrane protein
MMKKISLRILPIILLSALLNGCISHQDLINFNQGEPFPASAESIVQAPPLKIQPDDPLYIHIQTYEPDGAILFNPESAAPGNTGAKEAPVNFLVDRDGFIEMPGIGPVKLSGLTTIEARDTLRNRMKSFIKDPVVVVRFGQFRFTVLGEVRAPGTFNLSEERISLLEAIGTAGDMTNYANRSKVLVIREEEGMRSYGWVNLQSTSVFRSPYFYLRPNDVIYIEPTKDKIGAVSDQFTRIAPWIGAGITALNLIIIILNTRR